ENVRAQLREAGMDLSNLVKVTTYLSDRLHGIENRQIRNEVLGDLTPALTVVIVGLFETHWLVEIEAIAAAGARAALALCRRAIIDPAEPIPREDSMIVRLVSTAALLAALSGCVFVNAREVESPRSTPVATLTPAPAPAPVPVAQAPAPAPAPTGPAPLQVAN